MDRWADHQNFAAAGEQREEIASVHRAAIRSIQRVVSENATPHDEEYASAGIASYSRRVRFSCSPARE